MDEPNDTNYRRAYDTAIRLLSQRDHSRAELMRKLRQRFDLSTPQIETLLETLQCAHYLSEERFAESCVRSLIARGQGPMKIHHTLREKGVTAELADIALHNVVTEQAVDWVTEVKVLRERKFGVTLPTDFRERARQTRFLVGRGFYLDSINAVFHEKC